MAHKIVIDDIIGSWYIDSHFIRNELSKAGGGEVFVEIASPGGSVFEGIKIFNLFRAYSGHVHMHILGLAASMGSYIPLAGNKVTAENNAVFFIHNPWMFAGGDHREMIEVAKLLEGLTDILAKEYVRVTGKSIPEIRAMMDAETFFFGEEIKEAGFIDEIMQGQTTDSQGQMGDNRDDAFGYAKIAIADCHAKLKEKSHDEDIQQAAALLKDIKPEMIIDVDNKTQGIKNSIPAEVGKNKEVSVKMTIDTIKAEHSDLYNQIIEAGVKKERDRITAHLNWIDVAPESAMNAIKNGDEFTSANLSEYSKASLNKQTVTAAIGENPEVVTPDANLDSEEQQEKDLVERTLALSKKSGGVE